MCLSTKTTKTTITVSPSKQAITNNHLRRTNAALDRSITALVQSMTQMVKPTRETTEPRILEHEAEDLEVSGSVPFAP
jgi:hypothetical protein